MTDVFWHALVFGLAPLLRRLAALVLLPLYTHYLTPRDYGEIEVLSIVVGLVTVLLRLELRPAYMRAWLLGDPADRGALFRGSARMLCALGAGGALLFIAVAGPVSEWLLGYPIGWTYRAVLGASIFVEVASLVFSATLQAQLRSGAVVALGVGQFVAGASATVVLVVGLDSGPLGFFIGGLVGQLAGLVGMAAMTMGRVPPGGAAKLAPLVRYSVPLIGTALLFFVVRSADRLIVAQLLSVADLGLYAMGWTLANLLMTAVFLPLQASLDVWRHRMFRDPDGAARFAEVFRVSILIVAGAAVVLVTAGLTLFVQAADPRFGPAALLVPALSVAVLLQAGYSIVASAFFVTEATGRWSALFAGAAVVQIAATVGFVRLFGLAGAPAGIILANAMLYAGAALWGRRLWPVPYRHGVLVAAALLLPTVVGLRLALPLDGMGLAGRLMADAAACTLFAAAGFGLRLYGTADLAALWALVRGRATAGWRRVVSVRG